MIKSVGVVNYLGESMTMELTDPWKSGFAIEEIAGIGPGKATVNFTELTSIDGSLYNSSRLSTRNIVLTLRFMEIPDVETIRQKSYKYFPIKKPVTLTFVTDNRSCHITGYVESNEPTIFSNAEGTQISILCSDPYFYAVNPSSRVFSGVVSEFEFPFSNESLTDNLIEISYLVVAQEENIPYNGDSEVGMTIRIKSIGTAKNVTIYNTGTRESMKIDTIKLTALTGNPIIAGDEITISTVKGHKFIKLLRAGVETNILNCLDKNSSWLQLVKGDNILAYTADTGAEMLYFTIDTNVIYEGV